MAINRSLLLTFLLSGLTSHTFGQRTYAEKLGFPKDARVLILHVDDAGMSWDSNAGAIEAMERGVANSVSVMMPCPWVPGFVAYLRSHPAIDAGLHLTLTSEWKNYRWGPLAGKNSVPGLVDEEGSLWHGVGDVVKHATPQEVETEIRAQLSRARQMGFEPTHLDSHMGTLFAKAEFLEAYLRVGIENQIPVMIPGGHNTMILAQEEAGPELRQQLTMMGERLWASGLPVLDDLHNVSYDWAYPTDRSTDDAVIQKFATSKYIETISTLKPGLSMVIMHCTRPTEVFPNISDSTIKRKGDLLAMVDPSFKAFLQHEGIILTTWREVLARRQAIR